MTHAGRLIVFLLGLSAVISAIFFGRMFSEGHSRPTGHGPTIHILTYAGFVGSMGPGQDLIDAFKKKCACDFEVATAGDAGVLVERLRLARSGPAFDVVIGFDQLTRPEAEKEFQWHSIRLPPAAWAGPIRARVSDRFVPYDWAPMAFIYRDGEIDPPKDIDDLLSPRFAHAIAIEDPRTSTPGLQLLHWIEADRKGGTKDFLEKFKASIQSISPSWTTSYGLFTQHQAKMVFSYLTSVIYHWDHEHDPKYRAAIFANGHSYEAEFVAIPDNCRECGLAEEFVKTMLKPEWQIHLATKNFMFPVLEGLDLPPSFSQLPTVRLIETSNDKDIHVWEEVFHR